VAGDLQQLVEEQHAVARETHLSRSRVAPAANQARCRQCVMWRAEWPGDGHGGVRQWQSGDGVNRDDLERFLLGERREDGGHPACEHGLPRSGRADHQQGVRAGGRNLQRAFGHVLADEIGEVDRFGYRRGSHIVQADARRVELPGLELRDDRRERRRGAQGEP
jgi:hypothetical protein